MKKITATVATLTLLSSVAISVSAAHADTTPVTTSHKLTAEQRTAYQSAIVAFRADLSKYQAAVAARMIARSQANATLSASLASAKTKAERDVARAAHKAAIAALPKLPAKPVKPVRP